MDFYNRKRKKNESDSTLGTHVTEHTTRCLSFVGNKELRESFTAVLVRNSESRKTDDSFKTSCGDVTSYKMQQDNNPTPPINSYNTGYNPKNNLWIRDSANTINYQSTEAHSANDVVDDASTKPFWPPLDRKRQRKVPLYTENDLYRLGQKYQYQDSGERTNAFSPANRKAVKYSEKTTYCRPVVRYNPECIKPCAERKQKLQFLVEKLVEIRDRERQKTAWNQFIKELKLKHGVINAYETQPSSSTVPYMGSSSNDIPKIDYRTSFTPVSSNYCKSLLSDLFLQDSFQANRIMELLRKNIAVNTDNHQLDLPLFFEPNPYFCYPSSSQGRMLKQNAQFSCDLGYPNSRKFGAPANITKKTKCVGGKPFRGERIIVPHDCLSKKDVSPSRGKSRRNKFPAKHDTQTRPAKHDTQMPPAKHDTQMPPAKHDTQMPLAKHDTQMPLAKHDTQMPPVKHDTQMPSDSPSADGTAAIKTGSDVPFSIDKQITAQNQYFPLKTPKNQNRQAAIPELPEKAEPDNTQSLKELCAEIAKLKETNENKKSTVNPNVLENIENKLDLLIIAINSLMLDKKQSDTSGCKNDCVGKKPFCRDFTFDEFIGATDNRNKQAAPISKGANYKCNLLNCTSAKCVKRRKLAECEKKCDVNCPNLPSKDTQTALRTAEASPQTSLSAESCMTAGPTLSEYGRNFLGSQSFKTFNVRATDLFVSKIVIDHNNQNTALDDATSNMIKKEQDERLKELDLIRSDMTKIRNMIRNPDSISPGNINSVSIVELPSTTRAAEIDRNNESKHLSWFDMCKNNAHSPLQNHITPDSEEENYNGINEANNYYSGVGARSSAHMGDSNTSKFDEILIEEMGKSNKAKKDIEDILNGELSRPRAVQINFDVPTRERCTEVTDSLSRTRLAGEIMQEFAQTDSIVPPYRSITTIAVNTDPLSLLALLRISTDTIRQLLSYMQQFNYQSFLPSIPRPLSHQCVREEGQYCCHICGKTFSKASQFGEHIRSHEDASSRSCCVCRHLLEVSRNRRPGIFTCQYCGQCFTRAYCCELHEQSCSRNSGRQPDIPEDLAILR